MNIAHDHKTCITGHPQGCADNAIADFQLPIDWHALRSRLFAAHEVRTVLTGDAQPLKLRLRGSFDGCAASALTTYEGVPRYVNRNASGYFKPGEGNISPVVGTSSTGGRG